MYDHVLKFVKKINNGRYYKKHEYFSNLLGQLVWTRLQKVMNEI